MATLADAINCINDNISREMRLIATLHVLLVKYIIHTCKLLLMHACKSALATTMSSVTVQVPPTWAKPSSKQGRAKHPHITSTSLSNAVEQ
jgi:hypothetical protein